MASHPNSSQLLVSYPNRPYIYIYEKDNKRYISSVVPVEEGYGDPSYTYSSNGDSMEYKIDLNSTGQSAHYSIKPNDHPDSDLSHDELIVSVSKVGQEPVEQSRFFFAEIAPHPPICNPNNNGTACYHKPYVFVHKEGAECFLSFYIYLKENYQVGQIDISNLENEEITIDLHEEAGNSTPHLQENYSIGDYSHEKLTVIVTEPTLGTPPTTNPVGRCTIHFIDDNSGSGGTN